MDYAGIIQKLQECSHMIEETLSFVTISFASAVLNAKSFDAMPFADAAGIDSPFLDDTYSSMKKLNDCIQPVIELLMHDSKPTKEQLQDLLNHIDVVTNQMAGCWHGDSGLYFTENLQHISESISNLYMVISDE